MAEEKRYAQLPRSSVCLYAEAEGHVSLPDAVAALLAEDSNYRLRQIVQNASQFMRHAKRKRLTTTDFNQALHWSQVEPLYGYETPEPLTSSYLREIDLFVPDDSEVNLMSLANEELPLSPIKMPSVKMQWLSVEGVVKSGPQAGQPLGTDNTNTQAATPQNTNNCDGAHTKPAALPQPQQGPVPVPVSGCLMTYYDQITQAILGSDQDLLLVALEDLQTNDRLTPLLPYLLNFVSVGVKKMGHDLTQLSKLLHAIQSLVDNPSLYLGTQPYLTLLIQSVLYCVLEPLAALNPNQDHWTFRDSAARLLAHTLRRWSTSTNQLWCHTGQILRDCFGDFSKPFSAHYGALVAIRAMGLSEVESLVLPKIEGYWPHLQRALETTSRVNPQILADAHKVQGTLLLLSEHVLRWRLKCTFPEAWSLREHDLGHPVAECSQTPTVVPTFPDLPSKVKQELTKDIKGPKDSLTLYRTLYDLFGDALAIRLPCLPWVEGIRPTMVDKKPQTHLFTTPPELMKSGEEMLEAFYEGVCEDESARSPANSLDEDNSYEENSPLSDEAPAVELRIRSTISDPALGIKLTIAKLRPPVKEQSSKGSKRKKSFKSADISDIFERCQLKPMFRPLLFNFEGGTPIPSEHLRRPTVHASMEPPSQTCKLNMRMKKTGRKRQCIKPFLQRPFFTSFLF